MSFHSVALLKRPRFHHDEVARSKIKSLRDLAGADVACGVVSGSETERLFRESRDPLMTSLWARMASAWPSAFVHSKEAGIQRAGHEEYAFISDSPKLEYATFQEPCIFYKTNNFLPKQHYALVLNKRDRELEQVLDENLFHMHANGELRDLKSKWWVDHCKDATRRERVRQRQEQERGREVLVQNTSPSVKLQTDFANVSQSANGFSYSTKSHATRFLVSMLNASCCLSFLSLLIFIRSC